MAKIKCQHKNENDFCDVIKFATCSEICEYCQSIDGSNKGYPKMVTAINKVFFGKVDEKPEFTESEMEILLGTCEKCPHSRKVKIQPSEIKVLPFGLPPIRGITHLIAFVGNWLRKAGIFGLSCSLCGCSCTGKATLRDTFKTGCPDVSKESRMSRWDYALQGLKFPE